jgi:hypothetical protein
MFPHESWKARKTSNAMKKITRQIFSKIDAGTIGRRGRQPPIGTKPAPARRRPKPIISFCCFGPLAQPKPLPIQPTTSSIMTSAFPCGYVWTTRPPRRRRCRTTWSSTRSTVHHRPHQMARRRKLGGAAGFLMRRGPRPCRSSRCGRDP